MPSLAGQMAPRDGVSKSAPPRRSPSARPRASRPRGHIGRHPSPSRKLLLRAVWFANRLLRRLPGGSWLAERIERERRFTPVDIRFSRGGDGIDGTTIAFVSDLHAGSFVNESDLLRVFEGVAARRPDLVCLGGDLIEGFAHEIHLFEEALARIDPPLGVFAVHGNHEYFAERPPAFYARALEARGVAVLVNEGRRVERAGASLWVAGVDDLSLGAPDLARAIEGARRDEPILLLSHHPDVFVEASWAGVDLTLSGHTHAGQIVIFGKNLWKRSTLDYHGGWFEEEGAQLYVGRGAGVTGLPLRYRCDAEVPLLRIAVGSASPASPDAALRR